MSALQVRFEVSGIGLDRLLERLHKEQIILRDAHHTSSRLLTFSCPLQDADRVESLLASIGFQYKKLPPVGKEKALLQLLHSRSILAFLLAALIIVSISTQYIWTIDCSLSGAYSGEIRRYLLENHISPGTPKQSIHTEIIAQQLLQRFPRIAWVHVRLHGQTLQIIVTQGVQASPDGTNQQPGDIVSICDGIVESIHVYAGTAAVRAGDAVKKGDVLIRGEERGKDEQPVSVHAKGAITLRTWKSASAAISANELISTQTGKQTQRSVIASPLFSLSLTPFPDYLCSDTESASVPVGGAWIPLWHERQRIYETALEQTARNEDEIKAEAGALAMRHLMSLIGESDEIVDKFLDYSMIEGENMMATATAELLTSGGRFQPESSD